MKRLILTIIFFLSSSNIFAAAPTDWTITRITHMNVWGQIHVGRPYMSFSKNSTYLMIREVAVTNHNDPFNVGRDYVWGTPDNFKSWTDWTDYQAKIVEVPGNPDSGLTRSSSITWSKSSGEEGIVYWLKKQNGNDESDLYLMRANVVAGTSTTHIIMNDPASGDFSKIDNSLGDGAAIFGWIDDDTIMVNVPDEKNTVDYIELDVVAQTATWISGGDVVNWPVSSCGGDVYQCGSPCVDKYEYPEFHDLPMNIIGHGHWAKSLSNNFYTDLCCGTSRKICVYDLRQDADLIGGSIPPTRFWTERLLFDSGVISDGWNHVSWPHLDDTWFLGSQAAGTWFANPTLQDVDVYVYDWDVDVATVTATLVITTSTAGKWDVSSRPSCLSTDPDCEDNFSSQPKIVGNHDGTKAVFVSNDGFYSWDDKDKEANHSTAIGSGDWQNVGVFLVEFGVVETTSSFDSMGDFR